MPADELRSPTVSPASVSAASVSAESADEVPAASKRFVTLNLLALFGGYFAYLTPLAISLAIRIQGLTPGHEQNLGYVTGAGAVAALLAAPAIGQLSDRTRSRLGRRRPWILAAAVLGVVPLLVMAWAPNIVVLGVGWVLAMLTWGQVTVVLTMSQADRLSPTQRGKISGLSGLISALAPITGAGTASLISHHDLLLFLVPGIVGLLFTLPFVLFFAEPDSRSADTLEPLSLRGVLARYSFSFQRERDFSINLFVRFLFTAGIYLSSTFASLYIAELRGVGVADAGGTIAVAGLLGVAATVVGALGGGWLSDRLRRRKPLLVVAAAVFLFGAVLIAVAPGISLFLLGSALMNLGIGIFGAVDVALMLDVLPDRREAGRYVGITQLAVQLAHSGAPLIAPVFLAVAVSGPGKNYPALYLAAGLFAVASAVLATRIRSAR